RHYLEPSRVHGEHEQELPYRRQLVELANRRVRPEAGSGVAKGGDGGAEGAREVRAEEHERYGREGEEADVEGDERAHGPDGVLGDDTVADAHGQHGARVDRMTHFPRRVLCDDQPPDYLHAAAGGTAATPYE